MQKANSLTLWLIFGKQIITYMAMTMCVATDIDGPLP